MDTILQQKKKGQAQFRVQIDQLLSDSIFAKQKDQLTSDVLTEIFTSLPKQGLFQNGKVSIDKLMESIYETGCHFSTKEFSKIFNNKKQLRPEEIFQTLKNYDLTEFNLEEEITKHFFGEDHKFSIKKLDKVMKEMGLNELNKKDKEIMVECFDYDKNGQITRGDLQSLMGVLVERREHKRFKEKVKERKITKKVSTIKTTMY